MESQKKKGIIITLGAIALFIVLALFVGFHTEGVSTDEEIERTSSLVNYKYIVPSVSNIVTDSVDFTQIEALSEWGDRAYGVTLQLPTVVIEHLFDFQLDIATVFQIRHVYTFLLYVLAAISFYFLCRRLFRNHWYALFGLALFVVCPRILTEAFYNIKDLLFLSIFTINLFFCVLFMEKRTIGRGLGLMVTTALCVNARVVGAIAIFFCFVVLGIQHIRKKAPVKEYLWLVGTGLGSIALYILATPFLWADPVGGIIEILETFTDFTRFGGDVYYMGNMFPSADLPWHYLPVCILATIPVAYSILAAIGAVHQLCLFKRNSPQQIFLMLTLLFPVVYSVLRRPTLYNMWRHMYFLYPLLVIQAVNGFRYLMSGRRWISRGAQVITALSLCFTFFWLIKNSPYGYVYFNPAAKIVADTWFEKDYWGLSTVEMVDKMFEIGGEDKDLYRVHFRILGGLYSQDKEHRDKIQVVWNDDEAEYTVWQYPSYEMDLQRNVCYFYPKEYEVWADGMEIGALYYDLWDNYSQSTILDRAGEGLIYNINGVEWERREDSKVTLEGRLTQPIWTDHISVDYVSGDSVDDLKVEILSNGIWQEPSEVLQYGAIGHYYLDTVAAAEGIRLIYERTENDNQWNVNLYRLSYEEDNKNFAALPVASGTGDYLDKLETDDAAFDNDVTTRWSVAQDPGREYRIELEESTSLRGLQLILGTSNYDWPRALQIFTSVDGINWTEVSFTSRLNADICFDNAVECRYVRLVLGGTAQEVTNNWSIHEIILYRQNQ